MRIIRVKDNKKQYFDLLLLADEQESMVDRYLEEGEMFVMEDASGRVIAEAVVLGVDVGVVGRLGVVDGLDENAGIDAGVDVVSGTSTGDGMETGAKALELKSLAVLPDEQGKGYGRQMIEFICKEYSGRYQVLLVGTGDAPSTVGFYEHCGFSYSHRIKNFFTDNYDHPIYEDGIQLRDMIYLMRNIS